MTIQEISSLGEKFFLRKSQLDSFSELAALFEKGFNRKFPDHYFQWKYFDAPQGKAYVYQILNAEKELISTYSAIPEVYLFNGVEREVFLAIDATTNPAYQGKGLFSILAKSICEDLSQLKQTFVIGYPAPVPYKAYVNKLGWKSLSHVKVMFLPFSHFRPFWTSIKSRLSKPTIDIQPIAQFDERIDLYYKSKTNYNVPITKKYSAQILNWHCIKSQSKDFKINYVFENKQIIGYFIYITRERNQAEIIKIDFNANEHYEHKIAPILAYITLQTKAKLLFMWETQNQPLKISLEQQGFIINHNNPNQFGTHHFPVTIYSHQENVEGIDIYDRRNFELDIFTRDFV
jgi:hypothetical protein